MYAIVFWNGGEIEPCISLFSSEEDAQLEVWEYMRQRFYEWRDDGGEFEHWWGRLCDFQFASAQHRYEIAVEAQHWLNGRFNGGSENAQYVAITSCITNVEGM